MPTFDQFFYWIGCGLLGWCAIEVVSSLKRINSTMADIKTQIAVIGEKHNYADNRIRQNEEAIDDHENRIQLLETKPSPGGRSWKN